MKKKIFFFKKGISNSNRTFKYNSIWFIILKIYGKIGIGECNPILEKSIDFNKFLNELRNVCKKIISTKKLEIDYYYKYISYSSIFFGLEQVFSTLKRNFPLLFYSSFYKGEKGIPINGLIWVPFFLSSKEEMIKKIVRMVEYKVYKGFSFIKMKFNFHIFSYQYLVLKEIKKIYPFLKIRIDANGSFLFKKKEILFDYINKLYELNIVHSIEQPILSHNNNWDDIAEICLKSKLPIALDEDLTYVHGIQKKREFLDIIMPKYIVIKPSSNRGFFGSEEWISEANKRNIKWYISSSLESNIGINAITQWSFIMNNKYKSNEKHGLDTVNLYINNINSPIEVKKSSIWYNSLIKWDIEELLCNG
ncbi:enolase C-terminal domain-like protein [Blattabacterium cuenoti]|uniref:enolase C-terminal domain-like protein n=1 Tax=Blattabacterium cuenoti TaxID=1653831 RepID=UPI001EEC357D|nr:enolase C-terminal domain-like protein [Blattabacterium cuenoti]